MGFNRDLQPTAAIRGHLQFTHTGLVTANYFITPLGYGLRKASDKYDVKLAHHSLVNNLPNGSLLLGIQARQNTIDVLSKMVEGVDLDECAERRRVLDHAFVDATDLGLLGDRRDHRTRPLATLATRARDRDQARVVDADLRSRLLLDRTDRLALRPDDLADLRRVDLDGEDARRVLRKLRPGCGNRLLHLVQDVEARPLRPLRAVASLAVLTGLLLVASQAMAQQHVAVSDRGVVLGHALCDDVLGALHLN